MNVSLIFPGGSLSLLNNVSQWAILTAWLIMWSVQQVRQDA